MIHASRGVGRTQRDANAVRQGAIS
jgi:hypothetical protein